MSNVPRLNYFVENETAESATKNFALLLQKAFEQYQKLWCKYLDLAKKYEDDSPVHRENQETWKKENILDTKQMLTENIYFLNTFANQTKLCEKEDETCDNRQNKNTKGILEVCKLNFDSDIDDTIYETPYKKTKNIILPESPIFMRKDEQLSPTICKNEASTNNDQKNDKCTVNTDISLDFKRQYDDHSSPISKKHLDDESSDSISPIIIDNSPMVTNENYKRNKKKCLKKVIKHKQQFKDNSISSTKQQIEKKQLRLHSFQNIISPSKDSLNHNEAEINENSHNAKFENFVQPRCNTILPDDKKLRQTILPFYPTKNKTDNLVTNIADKNKPTTKFKKFLFNCESYTEGTLNQNEAVNNKRMHTLYLNDAYSHKETCGSIIQSNPESTYLKPQNKNQLLLKRKFTETDNKKTTQLSDCVDKFHSAFTSSCNSPNKSQSQTHLTKKQNINFNDDTIFPTCDTVIDDIEDKRSHSLTNVKEKQETVKMNNIQKTASTEQQECSLLDVFHSEDEDETYFEEYIDKENKELYMNVNEASIYNVKHTSPKKDILLETKNEPRNEEKKTTKCINTITLVGKDSKIKTKEGWSCWECAEYYKNKPGLSENNIQGWKNQCSRHRNIYYARQGTPPGFWDPLLSCTASQDS